MSNSRRVFLFTVPVILIVGATLTCRQTVSNAQSQADQSTTEPKPSAKSDEQQTTPLPQSVDDKTVESNKYEVFSYR